MFEIYALEGGVWTALDESDGVWNFTQIFNFEISDHNFFLLPSHSHLDVDAVPICQLLS